LPINSREGARMAQRLPPGSQKYKRLPSGVTATS
jgi:hypothetical protein